MKQSLCILLILSTLITGCNTPQPQTKAEAFPIMYGEQPHVIAVLPPINNTTSADAKEYYQTTIAEPLNQLGYYVLPVEILSHILASEGLTDTEVFRGMSMRRFGEVFGADAVLFTEINEWEKNYAVIASTLVISIDAHLQSTHSDKVLWSYRGTIVADLSANSSSGNPLADLIANVVVTAISTAMADYVDYARLANANLLFSIPAGRYHKNHMQDQDAVLYFPPGVQPADTLPSTLEAEQTALDDPI